MRRTVAVAVAIVAMAWCAFLAAPGVAAFPLSTCTLSVTSMDASGAVLGTATGGGTGGTRDDPLLVDPKGTVSWVGTTGGSELTDTSYHVEIFGVPTPLQGAAKDDGPRASSEGSVNLGDILPFDVVGLVYVSGALEVGGAPYCEGSGWIELQGDPVGTPGFVGGAGLALVGLATALASTPRRHPIRGALAGLIGGAGLALLSGVTGVLPLDEATPLAAVIGAVIVGLLLGVIDFGSLFGGGSVAAVDQAGGAGADTTRPMQAPESPARTPDKSPDKSPDEPPEGPRTTTSTLPGAPVVPTPGGQSTAAGTAAGVPPAGQPPAQPTPATAGPQPRPGIDTIRAAVEGLPPAIQPDVTQLLGQAEQVLATGSGTVTISSEVIDRLLAHAGPDVPAARLGDGTITFGEGFLAPDVTPVIQGGRLTFTTDAVGEAAAAMGKFDLVRMLLDQVNQAVADAGQQVTSVSVTPGGIAITTGPAAP